MTQKLSVKGRKPIAKGERNALLVAVKYDSQDKWRAAKWLFKCDCGNDYVARPDLVRRGVILSCGCYREDQASERMSVIATTHGHTKHGRLTTEYNSWRDMRDRCRYPTNEKWDNYGGRGIKVCERWDTSFENFLADMGHKPTPKHTLDRIEVNGNYEPGNCQWSTHKTQMRNRRNTRVVHYQGRDMSLAEACELAGQSRTRVNARLMRGWNIDRALSHGDGRSGEV